MVPEISGRIVQVLIANHQQVEKGAPLIAIDPVPYELALRQARAELDALKARTALTGCHARRYGLRIVNSRRLQCTRTGALDEQSANLNRRMQGVA
jgi:multidrug resistance efflux pump